MAEARKVTLRGIDPALWRKVKGAAALDGQTLQAVGRACAAVPPRGYRPSRGGAVMYTIVYTATRSNRKAYESADTTW